MTMISGLAGRGYRNLGSRGTPPVESEWRTVLRKSSGPLRPCRRLRASRTASFRDRGCRALRRATSSSRAGVHDVDVLGQRLAQRLGQGLAPPVGHQPSPDLVLDLALEAVHPGLELVAEQALLQGGESRGVAGGGGAAGSLPVLGLLHQALEQPVEVEVPQRAVEVVGPAHRPAGLHPGVPGHRLAGHRLDHGVIGGGQGPVEQLGQLLGGHAGPAAGAALAPALPTAPPGLLRRRLLPAAPLPVLAVDAVLRSAQREVDLEGRLVGPPVGGGLHQAGAQGVLQPLPVLEGDVTEDLGGVEVLAE